MPESFRIVLVLAEIEGFNYQEIAEMIDVPIGTVRSRLSRARSMLQKTLWHHAKERGIQSKKSQNDTRQDSV